MSENPSYYAIILAEVRYDKKLRADPVKYAEHLEKQRKRYRERRSTLKGLGANNGD